MAYDVNLSVINGQSAPMGGNMKIISQDEFSERINNKYPNQPFEIIEYTRVSKPFTIKCLKCGKIEQYSTAGNFLNSGRKGLCSCYNENNNQNKHEKNKILVQELINKNSYLSFDSAEEPTAADGVPYLLPIFSAIFFVIISFFL